MMIKTLSAAMPARGAMGALRVIAWLALTVVVIGLAACTTPRAVVDFAPGVDFAEFQSYAWLPPDPAAMAPPEDPRISTLAEERVRAAVDHALLTRGYLRTSPPDLVIALRLGLRERQFVDYWGPYGGPWLWRPGLRSWPYGPFAYDPFFIRPIVRTVTEATLAIDMFDAETKRPVWHGHATRIVRREEIGPAEVQRLVDVILADFPPSPLRVAVAPPRVP